MPGRLDHWMAPRCPECGGWDIGGIGMIHHAKGCSRNPYCELCGLEILPGERRAQSRVVAAHLDCLNEYREHLDEEHRDAL